MQTGIDIPAVLHERGGSTLEWETLRARLASGAESEMGRRHLVLLEPSADPAWIAVQQAKHEEMRRLLRSAGPFVFRGVIEPEPMLAKAAIEGAALEPLELLALANHAERIAAWQELLETLQQAGDGVWPALEALSEPLQGHDLGPLLNALRGKLEPDGSVSDDASPELARVRRALERQHRVIQESLSRALARLSADGSVQESLITVRGERFVIPVKTEFRRKVQGVVHGSSSSGQTVFVEPLEAVESNNELARLLDEEQREIHRILVAMTRAVTVAAETLQAGADVLAEADAAQAVARFAEQFQCVRPEFGEALALEQARHPLLEQRLRGSGGAIVPLTIVLPEGRRQMILSGPNTGGKSVALKTTGLLAVMAQAGLPVPAARASLPLFSSIFADIGDAQSIENNLSTFSAHVLNVDRISRLAGPDSLVLLDELGSATDPEEGAALAVAVAEFLLQKSAWTFITTHLTALKLYAAAHEGVFNAAVGFDEETLSPTYELRLGVPGASAGLNIAARLGLDPQIIAEARRQRSTQQEDIARLLADLHAQLSSVAAEREKLAQAERDVAHERERLAREGRAEQQAHAKELRRELETLIGQFEGEVRDAMKAIDDKTIARKMSRDAALRVAGLRREFSERFQSTLNAHDKSDAPARESQSTTKQEPKPGDMVRLRSLGREARVERVIDGRAFEVSAGAMKLRVNRDDIVEVLPRAGGKEKQRGGVSVRSTSDEGSYVRAEINVIGRTADEAESEVDRFIEQAFLAGLPSVRVVHGVGMGILRRTLREFLRKHPHVTSIAEPPYNEGGQGATLVELRQ